MGRKAKVQISTCYSPNPDGASYDKFPEKGTRYTGLKQVQVKQVLNMLSTLAFKILFLHHCTVGFKVVINVDGKWQVSSPTAELAC